MLQSCPPVGTIKKVRRWLRALAVTPLVARSGLFDRSYYLSRYPDASRLTPLLHYLLYGADEARDPNPLFDTSYYCEHNPDVVATGVNPLLHYLRHGSDEGRDPSPDFDTSYYAQHNPDVVAAGLLPLAHYLAAGRHEGREPKAPPNKIAQDRFGILYQRYRNFTMIPEDIFRGNLDLIENNKLTDGCIVECGVWRGGMIAAVAELLGNQRDYYLFDSFEGLPQAEEIDGQAALDWQKNTSSATYHNNCCAEIEYSEKAMKLSGAIRYKITKGWFDKTLPEFKPSQPIAVLRLDSDWYSSTKQCLENLYQYVAHQGIIIIDDYHFWDGCAIAVHEYLSENKLPDRIYTSSAGVCYIVKK